jgi:cellobiose epimerase
MQRVVVAFLCASTAFGQAPDAVRYVPTLEKTLNENILRFWYPRVLDTTNGGYKIRFDFKGIDRGDGPKMIVTQARMVWFFARMARAGYGDRRQMLEAADAGYQFLTNKMWDAQNGGFFWEVDATGTQKTQTQKHLYGQSFALYAISEYAIASQRQDVLQFAVRFFGILERRSHDAQYGGYREYFNPDWSEPPAGAKGFVASVGPGVKLMNTHLHLLESLTTFYRASKLPLAKERLVELIQIQSNAVVRKGIGACTDQYEKDWTPRLDGANARVSYGHDVENIWLLKDALDAVGLPVAPHLDLMKDLWRYSMKYGWDSAMGGLNTSGWFSQAADNKQKSWWAQAELLVSALTMWRLKGDAHYFLVFEKTWAFLEKYQIDWHTGEWWDTVMPDGTGRGDKAHAWKAAYHIGRAMIESIALLKGAH